MEDRMDQLLIDVNDRHGAITDRHATIAEELQAIGKALHLETGTRKSDVYELRELGTPRIDGRSSFLLGRAL